MSEKSRIEKLENRIEELEENLGRTADRRPLMEKAISRRDFLKKAGLGTAGLAAFLSPVSADYFIKDDSLSVLTSNDGGSTLTQGLFVDQNQNVKIPNGVLEVQGNEVATKNYVASNSGSMGFPFYELKNEGDLVIDSSEARGGVIFTDVAEITSSGILTVEKGRPLVLVARQEIIVEGYIDASGAAGNGGSRGSSDYGDNINGGQGDAAYFFSASGTGGVGGNGDYSSGSAGGAGAGGGGGGAQSAQGGAGGDSGNQTYTETEWNAKLSVDMPMKFFFEELKKSIILDEYPCGGSGGGGGGAGAESGYGGNGGRGGDGGGIVCLIAPKITGSGTIAVSGQDGGNGGSGDYTQGGGGGGGGGTGGLYYALCNEYTDSISIDASGGSGGSVGSGDDEGGNGGDGGDGAPGGQFIHII